MKSLVFSIDELYKCSTQSERRNLGLTEEKFKEKTQLLVDSLLNNTYVFSFKRCGKIFINSHTDKINYLFQNLVLRKIYRNIETIYKLTQSNRDKIISQIEILLKEKCPYWILKLDIKSFYESIDKQKIIDDLKKGYRLNSQTLNLVENVLNNSSLSSVSGLPRGLCISSIMSEQYLKKFDLEIKRIDGVYYYARFVDDIIIFCISEKARNETENKIGLLFNDLKLRVNTKKIQKWDLNSSDSLSYLGYEFKHDGNDLLITIALKKINKIKTRIVKSFLNFSKDQDFQLLKKRIKFLTGNMVLCEKKKLSHILVGIHYNYKKITDLGALSELDDFYRNILKCRVGKLGSCLKASISRRQRKELFKYSFKFGFEKKVRHYFSSNDVTEITRCWQ